MTAFLKAEGKGAASKKLKTWKLNAEIEREAIKGCDKGCD